MAINDNRMQELRRKNVRVAWMLAGLAVFFFVTSFPFWSGMFQIIGDQATR